MDQILAEPPVHEDEIDRFSYEGNHFPWWMLVIWVLFITFMTFYLIRYFVPNLDTWVRKPPISHFEP